MWRAGAFILLFTAGGFAQADLANQKFAEKQYAEAANAYIAIPQPERDAVVYNRLGISYHLTSQFKAAETAYRAALRLDRDNPQVLSNLAALYYSQLKFRDAENQARRAMEKAPDNPVMRLNLRAARYAHENTKQARDLANRVVKDSPALIEKMDGDLLQMQILMPPDQLQEAALHEARGDSLFARKLYPNAIAEYKESVAIDRYNASTFNRLGLVFHQDQNLKEAERFYKEALKQNPYFLESLNNLGTVEYSQHRYDSALGYYQKALKIRPASATVLLNMGSCLFDMKRYDEAIQAMQRAIQVDPHVLEKVAGFGTLIQTSRPADPVVSFYYAKIYAAQGIKDRAISYLNRALDEGFTDFQKIKTEPVFAPLAMEEGFLKILDRIAALSTASNTPNQ